MSDKIAIFDFCETLVNFQTADGFIYYCRKYTRKRLISNMYHLLLTVLLKTRLIYVVQKFNHEGYTIKKILLKELKGISKEDIDKWAHEYFDEMILPNIIQESLECLIKLKSKGYLICIASAGYDVYLKYFKSKYSIDYLISTSVEFKNKRCTGRYIGDDCLKDKKIQAIILLFGKDRFMKADTIGFSDSESDIPMLNACKKRVVVCTEQPDWIKNKTMEILLWKK